MDNKKINSNAKLALNMLKTEIASELGYEYNLNTDKVQSNSPQNTLEGVAKNIFAGEQVGGMTTRNLVAMGEKSLLDKKINRL